VEGIGLKLFTGKVRAFIAGEGDLRTITVEGICCGTCNPSSAEYEADVMRTPT
jgi:hypothetical protein